MVRPPQAGVLEPAPPPKSREHSQANQILSGWIMTTEPLKLLENADLLDDFLRSEVKDEFMVSLHKFYETHGREKELVQWAVNREVDSSKQPHELCRQDGFLSGLLYVMLFGELGRQYLKTTHQYVIKEIIRSISKQGDEEFTQEEMRSLLSAINQFVAKLVHNIYLVPISLREGFLILYKTAKLKLEMDYQIMASVLFLRFYCPPIIFPVKYSLLREDELQDNNGRISRAFVLASKILQCMSSDKEFEPSKPHSVVINAFLSSNKQKIPDFIKSLLDEDHIIKCRIMVDCSVVQTSSDKEKNKVIKDLSRFFSKAEYLKQENPFQSIEGVKALFQENDWKFIRGKQGVSLYQKKLEGLNFDAMKVIGHIGAPVKSVFESIRTMEADSCLAVFDNEMRMLQNFEDIRQEYYIKCPYPFPFTPRDFVLRRIMVWDEEEAWSYGYSIERDDTPPEKNLIRAEVSVMAYKLLKTEKGTEVTWVVHTDCKGSIPAWVLNSSGLAYIKAILKLRKILEERTGSK